jgi:serine/threonine protein kinase
MKPHKNLNGLIGYCSQPLCIITQFLEKGSLNVFLSQGNKLSIFDKVKIMKDIAEGMLHLSSLNIVHRFVLFKIYLFLF